MHAHIYKENIYINSNLSSTIFILNLFIITLLLLNLLPQSQCMTIVIIYSLSKNLTNHLTEEKLLLYIFSLYCTLLKISLIIFLAQEFYSVNSKNKKKKWQKNMKWQLKWEKG